MLKYRTRKTVRTDLSACVECLLNADRFLGRSSYVDSIKPVAEGVYHVRFRWRKWGMTRYYDVVFRVRREGDKIVYESVEGSKYPMRLEFTLEKKNDNTVVSVEASMEAGLMADLLGRKDYAKFIEELVETGFVAMAQRYSERVGAREAPAKPSCAQCLLYDPDRKYCYYLRRSVSGEKPPCEGKAFIPAP
ncbi:MAG: hypothetical protein F7C34_03365 [Desulfurococcales archaeon]|nr:hypothetical protein [Desulfurococcales archaeon]